MLRGILSLLMGATVAANPGAQSVTLDQLQNTPALFAGQMVQLRGQVDQCWNMGCSLCPLEATPQNPQGERCLAIDFDKMRGGSKNWGADMDSAYRYADVVVTAKFDPTCLPHHRERPDGALVVCLDRGSVLLDARVEQVVRRRRSSDGLIWRPDRLTPAPPAVARELADLVRPTGSQPLVRPTAVFMTAWGRNTLRSAVVCVSLATVDNAVQWPTSWQGALVARSTEDRYKCWPATHEQSGWRLTPN